MSGDRLKTASHRVDNFRERGEGSSSGGATTKGAHREEEEEE